MNVTVIITAYKEATTIKKALQAIADPSYSKWKQDLEIIQISPDEETLSAGKEYISEIQNPHLTYIQIKDPKKGKPHALNLGFKKAKGQFIVLTDGDVYLQKGALKKILTAIKNTNKAAICGQVRSQNTRKTFMGYISHLMTAAAHHKRMIELSHIHSGYGTKLVQKTNFFPLTGYLFVVDMDKVHQKFPNGITVPEDCLVDDAYISYILYNAGLELGYAPESMVYAKFPTHLNDYLKQKKRSTGGYLQLWKYGVVKTETKSRSFWHELRYAWFPIQYARNLFELLWSVSFYPLRLYLWILIWWEQKIRRKDFASTWVRIESTK
ncbi:glycosyltransferase family 2 protein [Candidatus Dojkabacteria bacterium]|uniref:Glycosyltransferase family 2 protein n=1 Tax=Candidatus Dojkabacteria bacterium TaxID=2099670 RepID=A0A955L7Q3_9BACT|nr:glycosyltransferase family 2 protein [Candidatus Dojkabacteria bacterium]